MDIDTETFILEVKQRRALWDSTAPEYGNKVTKQNLWMDITDIFGGTECPTQQEKHVLCTYLQKKWRNIRDCYSREKRRQVGDRNSPAAERRTPYAYYNLLSFLSNDIYTSNSCTDEFPDTEDWTLSSTSQMSSELYETELIPKKRRLECDIKQEIAYTLQNIDEARQICDLEIPEDEDRLFLLSLVKDFKKIPEHMKLTVKRKIINVLEEAHLEINNYSNMAPSTQHYMEPGASYEHTRSVHKVCSFKGKKER